MDKIALGAKIELSKRLSLIHISQQTAAPGYQAPQQNYQQPPAQTQPPQQNVTPFPQQTAAPQNGASYNF